MCIAAHKIPCGSTPAALRVVNVTALSDLLRDAKGERSVDDLIAAAEKRLGREIRPTFRATIYKALDGEHAKTPRDETLRLFADVFGLDVRDIRASVERPRGELGPWKPVDEANQLDQDQRDALDSLIKTIVRRVQADATLLGEGRFNASATVAKADRPAARDVGKPPAAKRKKPPPDDDFEPP